MVIVLICTGLLITSCNKDDDTIIKDPIKEAVDLPKEETVEPPEILTGIFRDNDVEGLTFSITKQNGVTNEKGAFSFLEGETITFKVGDLILGSALADTLITPISLQKP